MAITAQRTKCLFKGGCSVDEGDGGKGSVVTKLQLLDLVLDSMPLNHCKSCSTDSCPVQVWRCDCAAIAESVHGHLVL
jgi:hypothetical protein